MMASRFRAVYWVGFCAVSAVACYLVSQTVAAERAMLAKVEHGILNARRDIRQLQTEAGTLARMAQLERWNAESFALSAPRASQFLSSDIQLASLNAGPAPLAEPAGPAAPALAVGGARVMQASFPAAEAPRARAAAPAASRQPAPVQATEMPVLRLASYVRPKGAAAPLATPATFSDGPLDTDLLADIDRLAAAERARNKQ